MQSGSMDERPVNDVWNAAQHGMEQMAQLNAMERGQDSTAWSTNALHSATNGVLIVAAIAALSHPDWVAILIPLGVIGAFVSTAWFLIILRAHRYEIEWLHRARWLQKELKVPPECAVWQEKGSKFRPNVKGIPSFKVLVVLISGFYIMWIAIMMVAIGLSSVDCLTRSASMTVVTILALIGYLYFFWIQKVRSDEFGEGLQVALGLKT